MNRCKYCGRLLTLTPEYDTCIECQGRIMREATMPQGGIATNSTQPSMNIYDEAIKNVKSLDYLAEWYESDVVSDGYEEAKKNRETMTQNVIKTLEHAKKEHELLELYRGLNKSRIAYYTTKDKRVILDEHTNIMMMEGAINDLEKELEELK